MSSREKTLVRIAPITEKPRVDRHMRVALLRARRNAAFAEELKDQQEFDRAISELVKAVPVSEEIAEWFRNEKLIPQEKRSWKKAIRNPVILSIVTSLAVIAGIAVFILFERMHDFPGSDTARKLLTIASATRATQLESVQTEAGALGDLFFMKYRLEHYDVPAEFADLRTDGARVFDDDEGHRVAQISVPENRMQLFLFPADRDPKKAQVREFSGWKFVEQEGWSGAVQIRDGVCFMAALRGEQRDLAPYLAKAQE